jgi:hypothetical protein
VSASSLAVSSPIPVLPPITATWRLSMLICGTSVSERSVRE